MKISCFVSAVLLWCGTLYVVSVLAVTEQMCRVALMICVSLVTFRPADVGVFVFFPLLFTVANVECQYRVYECNLVRCATLYVMSVVAVIEWPGCVVLLIWVQ